MNLTTKKLTNPDSDEIVFANRSLFFANARA